MSIPLPSRDLRILTLITSGALLAYPIVTIGLKGGTNAVLLLLLLLSLWVHFLPPQDLPRSQWGQPFWRGYVWAMFALSLATLLSQWHNQPFSGHAHDAPARYFLALPVFFLLQRLPLRIFNFLLPGCALATLVGWCSSKPVGDGRIGVSTLDLIHYGDMTLLLGMLSLAGLLRPQHWALRLLLLLGGLAGLMDSLLSGSRGGWLALPVFVFILLQQVQLKYKKMILLGSVIALSLISWQFQSVQARAHRLSEDWQAYQQGSRDTSVGIRYQLYQAALITFAKHPLLGVGPTGFADEMGSLQQSGVLTREAAELGRGEVHNDLLAKAAGMGVPGLLALLAIYLLPLHLFRRARQCLPLQRHYALLGTVFVSSCLVFGLTVEFLNLTLATAFYSLGVAILLAACYNCHHPDSP